MPRRRASVHTAENPVCSPEMPPHVSPKSRDCLSAGVEGEWSLTIASTVPSSTPCHSRSRFAASRMGGQHLNSAAPSGTSSIVRVRRSEEHTSELQSLMRISYAVFCLKKKNTSATQVIKQNRTDTH